MSNPEYLHWNLLLDKEEEKLEHTKSHVDSYRISLHELDFDFNQTVSDIKQTSIYLQSLLDEFRVYRTSKTTSIQIHFSNIESQLNKITHKTRGLIFSFLSPDDPLHQNKSSLKLNDCKKSILQRLERDCNSQLSQLKDCLSRFNCLISDYEILHKQVESLQTNVSVKRQKAEQLSGLHWNELVEWCRHPDLQSYPVFDHSIVPHFWVDQGMQLISSHSHCFKANGVTEIYRITHVATHYLKHHFFSGVQVKDFDFNLDGRLEYGKKILNLMITHFDFSHHNVLIKNENNNIHSIIRYTRGDLPFLLACTIFYFSQDKSTVVEVLPGLRDLLPVYQQKQLSLISDALQFHDHRAISALFSGYL